MTDRQIQLPACRHCGRPWQPPPGVVADRNYCPECSADRRKVAADELDIRPIDPSEVDGPYLLPRAMRRKADR